MRGAGVTSLPLRNRVDPFGAIHIHPSRGLFMGNRGGCFHRGDQTLKPRHWASQRWITCALSFRGWHRTMMQPGQYTELFFMDEATALAAGHRPCFMCRRSEAEAFRAAMIAGGAMTPSARAADMDARLSATLQPVLNGNAARPTVPPATLPDGAMYATGGAAFLVHRQAALQWSFAGYGAPQALHATGERLTPAAACAALTGGFTPRLHVSAVS